MKKAYTPQTVKKHMEKLPKTITQYYEKRKDIYHIKCFLEEEEKKFNKIKKRLHKFLLSANLSPREEKIMLMRLGLGGNKTHSLQEVAKEFHVTRERIRHIETIVLDKLNNNQYNITRNV